MTMRGIAPKPQRCAIYTRKSTEHNLDLAFNSLDAQREACEAYIKSQAHEGWRLIPDSFDDGGLSGASLDRPALQRLLAEIRGRRVDIIVVYKVDRLTRSLSDFAKLVELFDEHGVSFVSVTQSFNTTSSMGRLTLNVLLSFAQFEREVIGERVRDKIAASKRKGIWVGGPVALGYRSVDKKLSVVPEEADLVRTIFERYLKTGSIGKLAADLDRSGVRPRSRVLANGRRLVAVRFMVGALAHLLKNRFYIGEVVYKGETHRGEHAPILDRGLFEEVQARLKAQAVRRTISRSRSPSFLSGLLFDDKGNRMSPSHANKRGVRYRYYVSQALLQNDRSAAGSIVRVSAPDIEALVCAALRGASVDACGGMGRSDNSTNLADLDRDLAVESGLRVEPALDELGVPSDRGFVDRDSLVRLVQRIVLRPDCVEITMRNDADGESGCSPHDPSSSSASDSLEEVHSSEPNAGRAELPFGRTREGEDPNTSFRILSVPWTPPSMRTRKGIVQTPSSDRPDPAARDALLNAIAKARLWMDELVTGRVLSFAEIASREQKVERHIRRLLPLAFLSPRIIETIADGRAPSEVNASTLTAALPHSWTEQERKFGFA